jgi:uncharacterized protein YraI
MLKIMTGFRSLLWIILAVALAACNLLTAPSNQSAISGPPVVQIAAPPPNATYMENVAVNIQALVSNAGPDIDRIEILVDEQIVETLKSPNPGGAGSFSIAQMWTASSAGSHTIGVTAFRPDGSSSAPATVTVNVVSLAASATTETSNSTNANTATQSGGNTSQQSAATRAPTTPPKPTEPPAPEASNTPNIPIVTVNQGINVRSGPSTKFNPVIGTMKAGDTAPALGRTPDGSWFKIQYYNSNNAWVAAQFVTASIDSSQLPVDAGPPIPTDTPVPPTAIPVTAVPTAAPTSANIVLGNVGFNPALPAMGSQATDRGGTISIKDYRSSTGQELHSTQGGFGPLQAGQTINYGGIFLTVTTFVGEEHRIVVTLNPDGAVPETSTADNSREFRYTLGGSC